MADELIRDGQGTNWPAEVWACAHHSNLVSRHASFEHRHAEAAEALGISLATLKRDWAFARAWLYDRLNAGA